ncbi:hypothetical protein IL306_003000 [Fusarium sp. DS 682]|nr:hypothetical protein IL306_003000 [Fusarium sp. DS 682]
MPIDSRSFALTLLSKNKLQSSSAPTQSLGSKIYDVVISPFQKLQSLLPRVAGTFDVNLTSQNGRRLLYLKAEIGEPSKEIDATSSVTTTFHKFKELPVELRTVIWRLAFRKTRIFRLVPMSQFLNIWRSISAWQVPGSDIPDAQNVAVDWPDGVETFVGEVMVDVWEMFPDCKRDMFVMRHLPLPDTDVRFTKVKDDDSMNIEYDDDLCEWGRIWPHLRDSWPTDRCHGKPEFEAVEVVPLRDGIGHP